MPHSLQAQQHRERLAPYVHPHLERQRKKEKHPVYDFLFEYYTFRPNQLMKWSPGFQHPEVLADLFSNVGKFPAHRFQALEWVLGLLQRTAGRSARYSCFGVHEWAMVYNEEDIRHKQLGLRLTHREVRAFVDQHPPACSHFDAFRFFSREAQPLNRATLTRTTQSNHEQPGCLHANMDLYKWAYKFYPWTPSDLVADCFELAWRIRETDMRASPYDLSDLGFDPIPIETPEGRETYVQAQQQHAREAKPLRDKLVELYTCLHGHATEAITMNV